MEKTYYTSTFVNMCTSITKRLRDYETKFLSKYSITYFHAQYLIVLDINKQMTLTALSDALYVDKSNTTRAVQDLLGKGYVEKVGDNQRKYSLQLTQTGLNLVSDYKQYLKSSAQKVFEKLKPEEITTLFDLLNKLLIGAKNVRDS